MPPQKEHKINIRLDSATYAMLEELCQKWEVSKSDAIRYIIIISFVMEFMPDEFRNNWKEYTKVVIENFFEYLKMSGT